MTRSVELKLYAYRKNRDGLIVSFVVHPNDEPQLLGIDIGDTFQAELRDPDEPNEALKQLMRSDGDREGSPPAPEKPVLPAGPAPSDGGEYQTERNGKWMSNGERIRTRAVMLCKDPDFQQWNWLMTGIPHDTARGNLAQQLGVGSLAELAGANPEAQKRFLLLEAQYYAERGKP